MNTARQNSGSDPPSGRGPITRNQGPKPVEKDREQLLAVNRNESDVFNTRQARDFLEKGSYVAEGDTLTWSKLSLIILQISQSQGKIPKPVSDGMRAVAILMEEAQVDKTAERIAERVMEKMSATITQLHERSNSISTATEELRAAAVSNTGTLDEFREDVHEIYDRLKEATDELEEKVGLHDGGAGLQANSSTPSTGRPMTYATVAQVHVSAQHEEVMARTHGREKYILVDKAGVTEGGVASGMTEKELVAKANMAVELMGMQAADRPGGGKIFVGAQRLVRGGVLYLMESVEAARWMRKEDVKEAFLRHYGGEVEIREKGFTVILEYVPVGFQPDISATLRSVEQDNGLNNGEISSARYLKEIWRRHPGQRTAFVAMTLRTAQAANKILRDGIIIEGRHVRGRKNLQEARRCMKCQGYRAGHVAANCRQIHDTCANCGDMHRTKDCNAPEGKVYCCNCKANDHKASDRNCPVFQRECERISNMVPENRYKYFPMIDNPQTWVLVRGAAQGETRLETQTKATEMNQEQRDIEEATQRVRQEIRNRRNWDEDEDEGLYEDVQGDSDGRWNTAGRAGIPTRGGWRGGARGWQRGGNMTHGVGRGSSRQQGSSTGSDNNPTDIRPNGTQRRLEEVWNQEPTDNTSTPNNGR